MKLTVLHSSTGPITQVIIVIQRLIIPVYQNVAYSYSVISVQCSGNNVYRPGIFYCILAPDVSQDCSVNCAGFRLTMPCFTPFPKPSSNLKFDPLRLL